MSTEALAPSEHRGFHLRAATDADASAILALVNLVQPHAPWTPEHYRWQLLEGPAGPARVQVAERDGRIVSLYVATLKRFALDGRVVTGSMVQDVMTHPDARGHGLLNEMARRYRAELAAYGEVAYTFPNKLSENSFRRNAWAELTRVPLRVGATATIAAGVAPAEVTPAGARFDRETADIWESALTPMGVVRDQTFYTWRYGRPATTYHRFWIAGDEGVLVLKLYDRGDAKVLHVCELLLRARALELGPGVLAFAARFAREQGAATMTAWLSAAHPHAAGFDAAGLALDPAHDRYTFVAGPAAVERRLTDPALWHLTQGDSDVY